MLGQALVLWVIWYHEPLKWKVPKIKFPGFRELPLPSHFLLLFFNIFMGWKRNFFKRWAKTCVGLFVMNWIKWCISISCIFKSHSNFWDESHLAKGVILLLLTCCYSLFATVLLPLLYQYTKMRLTCNFFLCFCFVFFWWWGGPKNDFPQRCPNFRTCEHATFHGRRDFAYVVKVIWLEMEKNPELCWIVCVSLI